MITRPGPVVPPSSGKGTLAWALALAGAAGARRSAALLAVARWGDASDVELEVALAAPVGRSSLPSVGACTTIADGVAVGAEVPTREIGMLVVIDGEAEGRSVEALLHAIALAMAPTPIAASAKSRVRDFRFAGVAGTGRFVAFAARSSVASSAQEASVLATLAMSTSRAATSRWRSRAMSALSGAGTPATRSATGAIGSCVMRLMI